MSLEHLSRQAQKIFEPYTAMIYFVPEAANRYKALGLNARQGYFCSRSAAMGRLNGATVAATFYNFNPDYVIEQITTGWQVTTPEAVLQERHKAVTEALTRLLAPAEGEPDLSENIEKAIPLAKKATEGLPLPGRPIFAAHAVLEWPTEPMTALWHGLNLLREYRGDGHNAALLVAGLTAIESLMLNVAFGNSPFPLPMLVQRRAWDEATAHAAQQDLEERGLLKDGSMTDAGRALREEVEQHTDRMGLLPFQKLGEDSTKELLALVTPLSERLRAHGAFGPLDLPRPVPVS